MRLLSNGVICSWSVEMWERNRRLHPENIFYEAPILAGPEDEIEKQPKQRTRKCSGFGMDPHEYKFIKPL